MIDLKHNTVGIQQKRKLPYQAIAMLAGLSMVVQDILGTLMVQAEARNHGWLAGSMDSSMWLFSIATSAIAITFLQGKDLKKKLWVISCVTIGNLIGSEIGVLIGQKLIK